jgi:integrase
MAKKYGYKPQKWNDRGIERWRIRIGTKSNGSPQYFSCRDEQHAKREQQRLLLKQETDDSLGLEAVKASNEHGIAACIAKLAVVGATVDEATDWFLATRFPSKGGDCTATEAGNAYLAAKAKANLEESTLKSYEARVGSFIKHFGDAPVNKISTEQLEEYFSTIGKEWSNNTLNPWKRFMVTLFNWFQENGYIALPHGAKNTAAKMTIPKRDLNTPKIAKWEEVWDMLYWYDRRAKKVGGYKKGNVYGCIAYLLFCLYLGIRKTEAYQITWEDIDFRARSINVLVEGAKTDKRRVNELPDNIWYWLVYLKDKGAKLDPSGDPSRRLTYLQRKYRESFSDRGAEVPDIVATVEKPTSAGKLETKELHHNIMRHTFCGYHLKLYESAGKTAGIMGNSEKKVRSDYHEVVRYKKDAEMFFKILPPEIIEYEDETEGITLDQAVDAYLLCKRLFPYIHQDETHCELYQHNNKIVGDYGCTEKVQSAAQWRDEDVITTEGGTKYRLWQ